MPETSSLQRPRIKTATALMLAGVLLGGVVLAGFIFKLDTPWGKLRVEYRETDDSGGASSTDTAAAASPGVAPLPGDYALSFDGKDDYVLIPSLKYDGSHPITIEANVQMTVAPNSKTGVPLVANLSYPRMKHGIQLAYGVTKNGRKWEFGRQDDSNYKYVWVASTAIKWVHLAGVFDGEQYELFVDGKRVATNVRQLVQKPEGSDVRPFLIWAGWGRNGVHANHDYAGTIDNVRISRVARYDKDFQLPKMITADENTLALYDFNQGYGRKLVDLSRNGHHGEIHGATWVYADGSSIRSWRGWPADAPRPAVAPFDAEQANRHQHAWADYLGVPVEKEIELPGGTTMALRLVPPGEFTMGSSDEEQLRYIEASKQIDGFEDHRVHQEGPQHRVRITRPFYLGTFEVTQRQWQGAMGTNPSNHKDPSHPVTHVTWDESQSFLATLNETFEKHDLHAALPTEAQWEYACRAGSSSFWYFGDNDSTLREHAWFAENSDEQIHPVGQLKPNSFGFYDIAGNVLEWCADWHAAGYYANAPVENPIGPLTGTSRVIRGGSWKSSASACRSAQRHYLGPDKPLWSVGIRVAASIDAVD